MKKKFTEAQIVFALRQAESGTPIAEIIRKMEISEVVGMSDPPGHFMLFAKLHKGDLTYEKRSRRGIQSSFQMDSS